MRLNGRVPRSVGKGTYVSMVYTVSNGGGYNLWNVLEDVILKVIIIIIVDTDRVRSPRRESR